MTPVAILGGTGYTARELIRLLLRHPQVEIVAVTTRQDDPPTVAESHPELIGRCSVKMENLTPSQVAERAEVVFCCLPHAASAESVMEMAGKAKIIDLSADYRLSDVELYEKCYSVKHPDAGRLGNVPYGLPELFRKEVATADIIANPGCFPTSAILPLYPLLQAGVIDPTDIVVDSKSGVSGAGRTPKQGTLFCEVNETTAAYSVGTHRHQPEIGHILQRATGVEVNAVFTPHLVPMERGILSTIYTTLQDKALGASDLLQILRTAYQGEPFIEVTDTLPTTRQVSFTNGCHMTARVNGNKLILLSVIDNVTKGASGAAIQNMNLMMGWEETTALLPV